MTTRPKNTLSNRRQYSSLSALADGVGRRDGDEQVLWTLGIRLQPLALGRHTVVGDLSLLTCSSEFFVQVSSNFGRLRLFKDGVRGPRHARPERTPHGADS